MSDKREVIVEYELKEIDTVSTFKMVFFITLAIGVLIAIIQAAAFLAAGNWEWAGGTLFMLPVFAALQGALILVVAWLYNLFAHRFGGIRMRWRTVEDGTEMQQARQGEARVDDATSDVVPPVSGANLSV
ncbi:MAG: hypothetical protein OEV28_04325 [Nitrospirota bacterium]|nr:hypothetical protein [Nitrospirota bacterium]